MGEHFGGSSCIRTILLINQPSGWAKGVRAKLCSKQALYMT